MKRLYGQRTLEHRRRECLQVAAEAIDVLLGQPGRWTQPGDQALEPVPNFAQWRKVTGEVGERRVQCTQGPTEFVWRRRRSSVVVWDELPHRQPEPVALVRPGRQ